jgi:hypothetical protein
MSKGMDKKGKEKKKEPKLSLKKKERLKRASDAITDRIYYSSIFRN